MSLCLARCREDFMTDIQVYSQLSEAEKYHPTPPTSSTWCVETSHLKAILLTPVCMLLTKPKRWVACRSVPCQTEQRIRNKADIPHIFLVFILFSWVFSLCSLLEPCPVLARALYLHGKGAGLSGIGDRESLGGIITPELELLMVC